MYTVIIYSYYICIVRMIICSHVLRFAKLGIEQRISTDFCTSLLLEDRWKRLIQSQLFCNPQYAYVWPVIKIYYSIYSGFQFPTLILRKMSEIISVLCTCTQASYTRTTTQASYTRTTTANPRLIYVTSVEFDEIN